jgi:hypothetical protein
LNSSRANPNEQILDALYKHGIAVRYQGGFALWTIRRR